MLTARGFSASFAFEKACELARERDKARRIRWRAPAGLDQALALVGEYLGELAP